MKIRDIITEGGARSDAPKVGNDKAKIARSSKVAAQMHDNAEEGARKEFDAKEARKRVRDLYGVELVDDWVDMLERPNGEHDTDKAESLLSTDMRK